MILTLKLSRLLRVLGLTLAIPLGLVMLMEVIVVLLARTQADEWPIVMAMDILIYVMFGLAFVLVPAIVCLLLLITLGKLRQPGSPAPPHAG